MRRGREEEEKRKRRGREEEEKRKRRGREEEEKRKRWEEIITTTYMTHNSRKTWATIRNLSNDPASSTPPCLVSANQVAYQLLINNRSRMSTKSKRPALPPTTEVGESFSEEEYRRGIAALKNNKAAVIDDLLIEQLNNLGPKTHKGLLAMLNNCFRTRSQQYGGNQRSSPY